MSVLVNANILAVICFPDFKECYTHVMIRPGQFFGEFSEISLSRSARVLRVEPDGEGRWLVGCELSSLLSDEEITALRAGCETASEK
jgi:hypothetical protein